MASIKLGHFLTVCVSMPRLGLKAFVRHGFEPVGKAEHRGKGAAQWLRVLAGSEI
jgi:hypothetical protein